MSQLIQIQLRRDTAANWTTQNPILAEGEPGFETDTQKIKYGDGLTSWTALDYFNDKSEELTIISAEPINGGRLIVNINGLAWHFDPLNPNHYCKVVGLSKTSVTTGQPVIILVNEQLATGLVLFPGAVYFGSTAGALTTVAPTTGISQPVGQAIDTNRLLINIQTPINKI